MATAAAALFAFQNVGLFPALHWGTLFVLELPVWFTWVLLAPLVDGVSRRVPLALTIGPGRLARRVLAHVVASLVASVAFVGLVTGARYPISLLLLRVLTNAADREYASLALGVAEQFTGALRTYGAFGILLYFMLVVVCHAAAYARDARERALRASELETLLVRTRLDVLELQLQPHFLFNTLHTISALMGRDVPRARTVIVRLGELLRYALHREAGDLVPVREELHFLRAYAAIQQARFREALDVAFAVAPEALDVAIPRLFLQPLVENALVHGGSDDAPLHVGVRIAVDDATLRITIADDGAGTTVPLRREGIGLSSCRARLQHLYPDAHRFSLRSSPGAGFRVDVAFPAHHLTRATTRPSRRADPPLHAAS